MTPILIEPLSEQAYELLRQLEALHILRMVEPVALAGSAAPRKWAGALVTDNSDAAAEWAKHLQNSRDEWERDI